MQLMQWKAESLALSYKNATADDETTPEQEIWQENQVSLKLSCLSNPRPSLLTTSLVTPISGGDP